MTIDINPKVLIWAREESGMRIEDVAGKLKIDSSILNRWENDGKGVLFDVLESLSKIYKRQTAVFFLPYVPSKMKKPKDYRNLSDGESFSSETLLAIRRTERYLHIVREVSGNKFWHQQYLWLENFSGKKENINQEVELLHSLLDAETDSVRHKDSATAYRELRKSIEEKLGIFTFQFPMPEDELDGFSYTHDGYPYAIVINNRNAPVRKIFTLFHELCHILKRNSGACKTDFVSDDQQRIEFECNKFAGKFLVPKKYLIETDSVEDISLIARQLNISGEAYLRTLFEEGLILRTNFFNLLESIREKSKGIPRKKTSAPISRIVLSKSSRGNKFFELITNAATNNHISYSTASDLLGLKVGNIRI